MKQQYTISLVALISLLSAPLTLHAGGLPYAGSNNYLTDNGAVKGAIDNTAAPLDKRAPLDMSTGETTLLDPLGDVLDRMGQPSEINAAWADIKSVSFFKDLGKNSWRMTVSVGGSIPTVPPVGTQVIAQIDRDSLSENNDRMPGERQNVDRIYTVSFSESGWNTSFEKYEAGVWQKTDTAATSSVEGDQVVIRIPFEELDETREPNWRANMSVDDKGASQIDAAPSVGFPDIIPDAIEGTNTATDSSNTADETKEAGDLLPKLGAQQLAALALIAGAAAVLGISLWRGQKKEDEKKS